MTKRRRRRRRERERERERKSIPAATACARQKSKVMLQWMPSASKTSAARIPSQVEANLMRMRSGPTPCSLYSLISLRAFWIMSSLEKLNRASTSVDTTPANPNANSEKEVEIEKGSGGITCNDLGDLHTKVYGQLIQSLCELLGLSLAVLLAICHLKKSDFSCCCCCCCLSSFSLICCCCCCCGFGGGKSAPYSEIGLTASSTKELK